MLNRPRLREVKKEVEGWRRACRKDEARQLYESLPLTNASRGGFIYRVKWKTSTPKKKEKKRGAQT